jgi:hypothetical protein
LLQKSLLDLHLGFQGALNILDMNHMMDKPENMTLTTATSMLTDRAPDIWENEAERSLKPPSGWFPDRIGRAGKHRPVHKKAGEPADAAVSLDFRDRHGGTVNFNPVAFVTAEMQNTVASPGRISGHWTTSRPSEFTDITEMDWDQADVQPEALSRACRASTSTGCSLRVRAGTER